MTTPLEALAYLSRQEPRPEHFAPFQAEVNAEKNDRSAVLLLSTNLEICLRYAIERNLTITGDPFQILFRNGAPLHSFEAKNRIGYSMGLFGDQTKANLDCIKGIRNAFAHCIIPITFATPEVKAVCDQMEMPEICSPSTVDGVTLQAIGALPLNQRHARNFKRRARP